MTLRELKNIIIIALRESQKIIDEQPKVVLSEADLERLVSWCIMNELGLKDYKKRQIHTILQYIHKYPITQTEK